jgi:hypothetical protein
VTVMGEGNSHHDHTAACGRCGHPANEHRALRIASGKTFRCFHGLCDCGAMSSAPAAAKRSPRTAEIIERLRRAAHYEFGNLSMDQRNLYLAAADAIEAAHALLHGAGLDHDALVAERDALLVRWETRR